MACPGTQYVTGLSNESSSSTTVLGMVLTPVLANFLEKKTTILKRYRWANSPIQVLFCGVCLTFATPLCCALFSQKASISVDSLEPELREKIRKENPECVTVLYNKGL